MADKGLIMNLRQLIMHLIIISLKLVHQFLHIFHMSMEVHKFDRRYGFIPVFAGGRKTYEA